MLHDFLGLMVGLLKLRLAWMKMALIRSLRMSRVLAKELPESETSIGEMM